MTGRNFPVVFAALRSPALGKRDLSWNLGGAGIFLSGQSVNHFIVCREYQRYEGDPVRFRLPGRRVSVYPPGHHCAVDQASLPLADYGNQPGFGRPDYSLDCLPDLGGLAGRN